jgi:hypothetical protein
VLRTKKSGFKLHNFEYSDFFQYTLLCYYQLEIQYKSTDTLEKTGVCQVKSPNLTLTLGTRTGQEIATALMQVFMDQGITTGRVFLWAASLQCFKLKWWQSWGAHNSSSKNVTRSRVHICSDSRAAIAALSKTTTESALVWESVQALETSKIQFKSFSHEFWQWLPLQF